jgi:chromosomal replication initiation ATPase DnaA
MYLTHVSFHWPLARVAFAFGRDRTTCGYACHKVEDLRENIAFDAQMAVLEGCLRQAPLKVTEVSL